MTFYPIIPTCSLRLYLIAALLVVLAVGSHLPLTTNAFVAVIRQQQLLPPPPTANALLQQQSVSERTVFICSSSSSSSSNSEVPDPSKQQRASPTGFSYVEEGVYPTIEEEIEAMGGDPSFLMGMTITDDTTSGVVVAPSQLSEDNTNPPSTTNTTAETLDSDASPVPAAWEWDGVEEEDAYFDE